MQTSKDETSLNEEWLQHAKERSRRLFYLFFLIFISAGSTTQVWNNKQHQFTHSQAAKKMEIKQHFCSLPGKENIGDVANNEGQLL